MDEATAEAIAAGNRRDIRIGDDSRGHDQVLRVDRGARAQPQTPSAIVAHGARHFGAGLDRQAERRGVAVQVLEKLAARNEDRESRRQRQARQRREVPARVQHEAVVQSGPRLPDLRRRLRARGAPRRPASARATLRARRARRRRRSAVRDAGHFRSLAPCREGASHLTALRLRASSAVVSEMRPSDQLRSIAGLQDAGQSLRAREPRIRESASAVTPRLAVPITAS